MSLAFEDKNHLSYHSPHLETGSDGEEFEEFKEEELERCKTACINLYSATINIYLYYLFIYK